MKVMNELRRAAAMTASVLSVSLISSSTYAAYSAVSVSAFTNPSSSGSATSLHESTSATIPVATTTGVERNPNFSKLAGGYLFPEIGRRRAKYAAENPDLAKRIISLGIGDTTQPIPTHILGGLKHGAAKLGSKDTYTGYGNEQGNSNLRQKIATVLYNDNIEAEEVFVSDGAKCDIMRLQQMFGSNVKTAVQDPSYPVYVDTSVMMGQTGTQDPASGQYSNIVYMPCNPSNNFYPRLADYPRADIVYICSPNNPTGAVATKEQLEETIRVCKERGSIVVFDAAYAPFIRTPGVPKSIFECEGAKDVAIEVNSFSKYAGFTGVRLGWTVVPKSLRYKDGTPVWNDFNRVMGTAFNGASNIVQEGGLACLDEAGLSEINSLIAYYLENANLLRETFQTMDGFEVYGGIDAPYVFVKLPPSLGGSWDAFQTILEKTQVVTIPGAGFGPSGEGFLRLSSFAPRESIVEACQRIRSAFG